MQNAWCRRKLRSMTLTASLVAAMGYIALQLDDVIIGQTINPQAVGAVGLVAPFVTFVMFVTTIVSDGVVSCIISEIGKLHKHRASIYFTNGAVMCVLAGILCLIFGLCGKDLFIGSIRSNPEIYRYADTYFRFYLVSAFLQPIYSYYQQIVYIDGDEALFLSSYIVSIVSNIFFSVQLSHRFGIAGIALGTAFSFLFGGILIALHFILHRGGMELNFKTSVNKLRNILSNGITAAASLVFLAIFTVLLNRFFLAYFSEDRLPILAVAENAFEFTSVFTGIGIAASPFFALYNGEDNIPRLQFVQRQTVKLELLYSSVCTVLMLILAPYIVRLFGLNDPALMGPTVRAVRIISLCLVPSAYFSLLFSYHTSVGSLPYAGYVAFLKSLAVPMTLVVVLSVILGSDTGVWIGISAAPFLTILFAALPIYVGSKRLNELFVMKNVPSENVFSYEISVTPDNINILQHNLDLLLSRFGICRRTRNNVTLIVEEIYMLVIEANPGKMLTGECTLSIGSEILLVLKDNGKLFDVTNCDTDVTSFRRYMLSCVLQTHPDKINITTLCCNRNAFRLPIEYDAPQSEA